MPGQQDLAAHSKCGVMEVEKLSMIHVENLNF